ncbi:acyl-coenzyme A thioesterase 11 [Larimichthys crocea]|nr:acyl-coenzyme A thioesterase 11 [Larimichthys crocea]XP_019122306.1 acyl-coenzyme A thioesterase 11 [Larimichthys crocea]XP_019122307.1 acyl-coenzyme A thioesterase 11 [Larimichthys crocea]
MSSRVSADLEREEEEDEEEEEEEEEEESVNPTEVKMSQIVMPCHSNHRQELSVGQLLKWIDSTACLSAERHAVCPCVTASMDDIHFEHTIRVGQVVNIKAKVNRAFNTSMEVGIQVSCEDLFSDRQWRVCHAYATFVTQRTSTGQKVVLKPIVPHTQREQVEYSVAAERRRVRMLHDDIIKDLLSNGSIQQADNSAVENAVAAERTKVESVELVLPPHANHQVNTFGGQIMAWMVNVAMIAASRLCQAHPTLRAIDMFTFRGPSQIGDRLLLRAIVNNAFKNSIEVGVRAEAYQEEGANRHINSAFMTFEVLDNHGKPCTLPRIRPEPLEGERRFQEAIARKKIRLDRKYIISRKQGEVPLSVPWDPTNQVYLSYNNVSALKMMAAKNKWRLSSEKDKVRLYTLEQKSMLSFRVEAEVDVPAHRAFCLLAELRNRPSWDTHYQKCELIHRVDDDDFLYRVVTPSVQRGGVGSPTSTSQGEGLLQDFILLACKRKPCGSGDPYVIALRSVSLPTYPPTEEINRGEVLCAGFTILETKNNMSLISYYNQASPEVLPYISTDIAGLSSSFYNTFCSCSQYLTKNRMQLASEHETDQDTNTDSPSCASVDDSLVVAISSTKL